VVLDCGRYTSARCSSAALLLVEEFAVETLVVSRVRYAVRCSRALTKVALGRFTHAEESPIRTKPPVVRQGIVALAAVLTILGTAALVHPVFMGAPREVISDTLATTEQWLGGEVDRTPWVSNSATEAVNTEQFRVDREAFALDLIRTGRMNPVRARSIADVAVREAYRQRIPPALVLGIMLTENDEFKSTARSSVGAVGLMQVYGRLWRRTLGRKYGTDLHDDETNLRYGVHILRYVTRAVSDTLGPEDSWRKAMLGYNGCVRGTNTPSCSRYPDVVRSHVDRSARSTCGGKSFEECVVRPLWFAMRDERDDRVTPRPRSD
jgi:hypothetical protein